MVLFSFATAPLKEKARQGEAVLNIGFRIFRTCVFFPLPITERGETELGKKAILEVQTREGQRRRTENFHCGGTNFYVSGIEGHFWGETENRM